jgi:hypothetical protein
MTIPQMILYTLCVLGIGFCIGILVAWRMEK